MRNHETPRQQHVTCERYVFSSLEFAVVFNGIAYVLEACFAHRELTMLPLLPQHLLGRYLL